MPVILGMDTQISSILHMAIPVLYRLVRTSKPCSQLMKEKPGLLSTEKFLQHVFSLATSALDVDSLQYRNNVLQ